MYSDEELEKRRAWFKLLACNNHTWPISNCSQCWNRIMDKLDVICAKEQEQK